MARTPAAERWSHLIDQHEASGLTIRAFAEKVDVNPRTLAWWRSQLGAKRRNKTAFVELTVAEPPQATASDATVVLALDGYDAHVVVDHQTDLGLLRRLLGALC